MSMLVQVVRRSSAGALIFRTALALAALLSTSPRVAASTVAANQRYSTFGGAQLNVPAPGLLQGASTTAASLTLIPSIVTQPLHGAVILNADGSFLYAPDPAFAGTDSFTFIVTGDVASAPATVTVANNFALVDDSYAVAAGTTLTVGAPGVLSNDRTMAGTSLTLAVVSGPSHGSLSALSADGSFTYTPGAAFGSDPTHGFVGSDSFTYSARDAFGHTATATVTLTNSFAVVRHLRSNPIAYQYPDSQLPLGLVRGPDGKFYGTTNGDGWFDGGHIFRVEPDGSLTTLKTFTMPADANGDPAVDPAQFAATGNDGAYLTGLVRASDGNLYGTAESGGAENNGVVYRLMFSPGQTNPTFQLLHAFSCVSGEGLDPWGTLVEGRDGFLYGTNGLDNASAFNGCWGSVLYRLSKDGSRFDTLASFNDATVGFYELGPVVVGNDGSVYGTTKFTASGYGGVFKLPAGSHQPVLLHAFDPTLGEPVIPSSGLIRGIDGAMYGTTQGLSRDRHTRYDGGSIFRITESGQLTTLYRFPLPASSDPSPSIYEPAPPLLRGGDGKLYGAAYSGGADGAGGLFQFDLPEAYGGSGGGLQVLHEFNAGRDGYYPLGLLGVGADRHLYGPNAAGGPDSGGAIFGPLTVTVANLPPQAYASASPAEAAGPNGATVTLTSQGTVDDDFDSPLMFTWRAADPQKPLPAGFSAETTRVFGGIDYSTGAGLFPIGTTPVTLVVDDGQPHAISPLITDPRSYTFDVVVRDTTPPAFSNVPSEVTRIVAPAATSGVVVYVVPTATDLVDGRTIVSCTPASGSSFAVGASPVVCTSTDHAGNTASVTFTVTVSPDRPPVANGASASTGMNQPVHITLTASDADGQALAYTVATASARGGNVTVTGNIATYTPPAGYVGPDSFVFTVNDGFVASDPATVTIDVLPHSTPDCTAAAARPPALWPPNHQLVPIEIANVTNADGSPVTVAIGGIFQDEPTSGLGSGDVPVDGFGVGTSVATVRAERAGNLNGRVYHIRFTATANDLSCSGDVTVGVPRDQGQGNSAIDDGPVYDSTVAAPGGKTK